MVPKISVWKHHPISLGPALGNTEILGKQNYLFSSGPLILLSVPRRSQSNNYIENSNSLCKML